MTALIDGSHSLAEQAPFMPPLPMLALALERRGEVLARAQKKCV